MWKSVKLGEIIEKTATTNPSAEFPDEPFEYIDVSAVCKSTLKIRGTQTLLGKNAPSRARRQVKAGDVIFATVRPTLKRVAIVPSELDGQICSTGYIVFRANAELVISKYLFYCMISKKTMDYAENVQTGASYPAVTDKQVKELEIILPPLAEQQRIIDKLDASFVEINKAIEIASESAENAKALANSALTEIFVAESRDWNTASLADTCSIERGSSPRPIKSFLTEGSGVNWIKIGDTDVDGKYVRSTKQRITHEGAKKSRFVRKGDFILTNSMSYGRPYIMEIDGYIHDGWFALRLKENIDTEYYYYLLASPYVQNQFHSLAAGAVVKNISSDLVKRVVLPIPPISRQIEIRNRILDIEAHSSIATESYKDKCEQLRSLKSSMLARELQPREAV